MRRGKKLGPWHLNVEVQPGLTTAAFRDAEDTSVFYDPKPGLARLFARVYPEGLRGRSVLDCACNCGAYSFAAKDLGAGRAFGFDVRDLWIDQARFLAEHREDSTAEARFEACDLYDLPKLGLEPFDVTFFQGIFYHLPDPVSGLRVAADMTKELLVLSTATRHGLPDGVMVAGQESTTRPLSGVHGLQWFPTGPEVLKRILGWMGFEEVRCTSWWTPPQNAPGLDVVQLIAARTKETLAAYDASAEHGLAGARDAVLTTIPPGATCIAATGVEPLPDTLVGERTLWPFPPEDGRYVDPAPSAARSPSLIDRVEEMRSRGADYFVVPNTAFVWFAEHEDLHQYMELRYPAVVRDGRSCIIYALKLHCV